MTCKTMIKNKILLTSQASEWELYAKRSGNVFSSLGFALVNEKESGFPNQMFVVEDENAAVIYSYQLRDTTKLPFSNGLKAFDVYSPDYGGPVFVGDPQYRDAMLEHFRVRFEEHCRANQIAAEFARFHLWFQDEPCLEQDLIVDGPDHVYVDLTLSHEELWSQSFQYACRKNITRAQKEELKFFQADSEEHIIEFHRIYSSTMERRQAHSRYLFSLDNFMDYFHYMSDQCAYFLVEHKGQVIAATLYLYDADHIYSYLGGADMNYQQMRPTNYLIYNLILWAKDHNIRRFILGGGYQENDGIFRFKQTFSPLTSRRRFYRRVIMPDLYEQLSEAARKHYGLTQDELSDIKFFPKYRYTPV